MLLAPKSNAINLYGAMFVLSLAFFACEDQTAPIKEREIIVDPVAGTMVIPGGSTAGGEVTPGGVTPENPTNTSILLPAGDLEKVISIGGEVELSVYLYDQDGEPIPQSQVQFKFLSGLDGATPSADEAALSSARTTTNEQGIAKVNLLGGNLIKHYQVEASSSQARRTVVFEIDVVNLPMGSMNIAFDYQGVVPLQNVELYVLRRPDACEAPYYLAPPMDPFLTKEVMNLSQRTVVDALLAGESFAVIARARTADGVLVAGGCEGDIRILENNQSNVTISLFLLPLNPAGRYEMVNHFDFAGAIPGTLGTIIQQLVAFFGDQNHDRMVASVIFDAIEELARQAAGAIGGLVVELIGNWVENDLNRLINDYIDNDGPQWLRDFFTIGSDLISIVSNLEVLSEMNLSKPRSDGTFDGSQNWVGLAFYWRINCANSQDPECGRFPFRMDDIANGVEEVNLVFGQFTGRVHSYNQGVINLHTMDLQYGRLILFVLNHVILPAIANGATTIRDALLNLANCPAFASRLTGGNAYLRLGGINIISRDRIQGWCTTVMEIAGDGATLILNQLRLDTRMDLEGNMVFVEENSDLVVDRITDGVWRGHLRTGQDSGAEFSGDYEGHKIQIMPDMMSMQNP